MKQEARKAVPQKRKKLGVKKRSVVILAALTIIFAALNTVRIVAGINSTNAVHINPLEIENATLAIGSHLVHLSALTSPLYEVAKKSVEDSGQGNIYYKSELAKGAWFDITTATSLKDISTKGNPVTNATIAGLYFAYHTHANGITYDLMTGQEVNIFDLNKAVSMREMEELMPLDIQHKLLEETQGDSEQGKQKIDMLNTFWAVPLSSGAISEAGASLTQLQDYFVHISKQNAPASKKTVVQNLMDTVDAKRQHEIMTIAQVELQKLTIAVSTYKDPEVSSEGSSSSVITPAAVDAALQTSVNDSLANVTTSKANYAAKMLEQGGTIITQLQYKWQMALIQNAGEKNFKGCEVILENLVTLENILSDVVEKAETEASLISAHLINTGIGKYTSVLRAGVSDEYTNAKNAGNTEAVLRGFADENANKVNSHRAELQFLIDAYCLRISGGARSDYLDKLLKEAMAMYSIIPVGGFSDGSKVSVDLYIEYLATKQQETNAGESAMKELDNELEKLKRQSLAALDKNDLDKAATLQAEMKTVEDEIYKEMKKIAEELNTMNSRVLKLQEEIANASGNTKNALENELAVLQARIKVVSKTAHGNSLLSLMQRLKDECTAIVNNTAASAAQLSALSTSLNTITEMLAIEPVEAYTVLREIAAALETGKDVRGDKAFDADIKKAEEALTNAQKDYLEALSSSLKPETLEKVSKAFFDAKLSGPVGATLNANSQNENLTENEKEVVIILAMNLYAAQNYNTDILESISRRAQKNALAGNTLVFETLRSSLEEYVPVSAIALLNGMRYVWEANKSTVTISRAGQHYSFQSYSTKVKREESAQGSMQMLHPAIAQNEMYLHTQFAKEEFGVWAIYLFETENYPKCAVVTNEQLAHVAEELYVALVG